MKGFYEFKISFSFAIRSFQDQSDLYNVVDKMKGFTTKKLLNKDVESYNN